jgi:membrane-associated protease RseP (regulator of RpoE activity)
MHMVIAFALFFAVYTSGGRQQNTGISTVRGIAESSSPASSAGIVVGDTIVSIGGIAVSNYNTVAAAIQSFSVGESISVVFEHDGVRQSRDVVLAKHPSVPGRAYLGVMADDWGWEQLGVFESVGQSISDIGNTITGSVKGVVVALNPINSIRHLTKSPEATLETRPTTVVGISEFSGTVGRSDGLKGVLVLLASINVFVGVFNMFPLLPFDGGHAAIAIYERVRSRKGRPYKADINKMVPVATLVVGLLSLLLLTGLYLDITQPLG